MANPFTDLIRAVQSAVKPGLKDLKSIFSRRSGNAGPQAGTLCFPGELRSELNEWPYIRFSLDGGQQAICLPMPAGITFSDSAEYSSIDLGIIDALNMVTDRLGDSAGSQEELKKLASDVSSNSGTISNILMQTAASSLGGETLAASMALKSKVVLAPKTNTVFQRVSLRSFQFNFKLVARSESDAKTIKLIIELFRDNLYPLASVKGTVLGFPDPWIIRFYDKDSENEYIPKIKKCNLTNFSSVYNPTSNMLHHDGSPIEIDISLGFQEMKSLTRQDIQSSSNDYYNHRDD